MGSIKEKLKYFLKEKENQFCFESSSKDVSLIIDMFLGMNLLIDEFFDSYQPERSKREDPYLKIEDLENMTKEQMIERMKELEDHVIRKYIFMTSCYICPKCMGCGALNTMET